MALLADRLLYGKWLKSKDFCFYNHPLLKLKDLTLGVVGNGKTGRSIIKKASKYIVFCKLEELLKESDIISFNCPLNKKTKKIIFYT